jgi:hypothetical protein
MKIKQLKTIAFAILAVVMLGVVPTYAHFSETFNMIRSPALAPFKDFVPNAKATVTITSIGTVEVMTVVCSGLPPNTDFDFFVIQVPNAPFGLAWYQGDIETGPDGTGAGVFIGRFSIETFIVAPGSAPAPVTFPHAPFPSTPENLGKEGPVQLYHLGLWFNDPADAKKAGGPETVTPFNGEHNAGVQVLNTSNSPINAGPLIKIRSTD